MVIIVDWIATVIVRGLSFTLQLLPLEASLALGRAVGLVTACLNKRRRVAYANLKAAFGDRYSGRERKRLVRKLYCHLAQNMVETMRFPKMDQDYFDRHIVVEHRERYEQAIQSGRGVIFLTPHFGNWELSQMLSSLAGKPMHVLARRQKYEQLDTFINELRTIRGATSIHKGGGVRDLIRVLKAKGYIGALSDLSGGKHGLVLRFFGRKTTVPPGIFAIAKRTNSIILPCFLTRFNNSNHRVFIEKPIDLAQFSRFNIKLSGTKLDPEDTITSQCVRISISADRGVRNLCKTVSLPCANGASKNATQKNIFRCQRLLNSTSTD